MVEYLKNYMECNLYVTIRWAETTTKYGLCFLELIYYTILVLFWDQYDVLWISW